MKTNMNMPKVRKKEGNKKPAFKNQDLKRLRYAFISGILIIVLFVLSIILNNLFTDNIETLQILSMIQNVLTIIFIFYFFSGFILLGREYDRLLKVASILMIILIVGFYLLMLFSASFFGKNMILNLDEKVKSIGFNSATEFFDYLSTNQAEAQQYSDFIVNEVIPLILPLVIMIFAYLLVFLVAAIIFGVGLIKIGGDVKYAKIAGILEIIGAGTMIFFVGIFIWLGAYIFMLIILFRESKKQNAVKS